MNTFRLTVGVVLFFAWHGPLIRAQTNQLPGQRPLPPLLERMRREGVLHATAQWNNRQRIDIRLSTFDLTTNFVVATVETGENIPDQIAVVVKRSSISNAAAPDISKGHGSDGKVNPRESVETLTARMAEKEVDWQKVNWMPFTSTVPINLGPGDGKRTIWIAGKWNGQFLHASATEVRVDHAPPVIVITNPPERVTSQPMIQLQGYSDEPLQSIRYDAINASNRVENEQGFVNHQEFDSDRFEETKAFFTCYDIDLALGTNTIILRCQDQAGNVATNSYTYILSLDQDKTPPVISLDWPLDEDRISGDTFTARGRLDDPTARITGLISANGSTNTIGGLVERNGYFWVENFPLGEAANQLTLTATDAAGNWSATNLVVNKADGLLVMDPVPPDQLLKSEIAVTGKVLPANQAVWVNGVQAKVNPDGSWMAYKVPVRSPNGGGTATFEITAIPPEEQPGRPVGHSTKPKELVSVATGFDTNGVTLNTSQPACGTFNLHLSGTAGHSFVLLASTNLLHWIPILTNYNSAPTFDFTDTNVAAHRCRFFRVMPFR